MNARALAIWAAAGLVVGLTTTNPVYRALVALAALDVLLAGRRSGRSLRPLGLGLALAATGAVLLNVLLSHVGADVFATLPSELPGIGGSLTIESAVYGVDTALGLVAAVLAVAPLSYLTEPHELVDALPRAVERSGIVVAAALNLVPGIGRSFEEVREAQLMRGWRPAGLRSWSVVIVPVVLTAIEGSMELAEAMEARAFGSGPRSRYAPAAWRRRDVAVTLAAVAAMTLTIVGRMLGWVPDWYPYPALTFPPVSPPMVGACLLLALPALR